MKFPKMIIPMLATGIIGVASFAAPPFLGIEKTPVISGSVFYSMKSAPNGFDLVPGYNNSDLSELIGKQNPNPIKNQAGTCTFSPQVSYLPSSMAGRGDKFLTLSYIYDNAQVSTHLPAPIKRDHVSAGKTYLEVLTSSYDVSASKDNSDNKKGYYRTVAVRAMDATVSIPYATGAENKGIPAIVMTYDCQTPNDYKDTDFSALLSTVNVNLTDTISNAPASKKDTVKPTESAVPTDGPTTSERPTESPKPPTTASSTTRATNAAGTNSSPVPASKSSKP